MSSLSAIKGHRKNIEILKAQYRNKKVPHCYIFSGPRGVGKRSLSAAFAGLLNCGSPGIDGDACGECKSCICLRKGAHPDIVCVDLDYQAAVLDEKKGKGVYYSIDLVHELSRMLNLKAAEGSWRTVIIDEAELLTDEAGGALLKTLEEPPENTVFILIVENLQKILPTIRSRSQILHFGALSYEDFSEAAGPLKADIEESDFYRYNGSPGLLASDAETETVFDFETLSGFEGSGVDSANIIDWLEAYGSDKNIAAELFEKITQKIRSKKVPEGPSLELFDRILKGKDRASRFVNSQLILTELYLKSKGL